MKQKYHICYLCATKQSYQQWCVETQEQDMVAHGS